MVLLSVILIQLGKRNLEIKFSGRHHNVRIVFKSSNVLSHRKRHLIIYSCFDLVAMLFLQLAVEFSITLLQLSGRVVKILWVKVLCRG